MIVFFTTASEIVSMIHITFVFCGVAASSVRGVASRLRVQGLVRRVQFGARETASFAMKLFPPVVVGE